MYLSSFERVRVDGPFAVTIATGRSPGGTVTGEAGALDGVALRQDGTTLVVHAADRTRTRGALPSVALSTPHLTAVGVAAGGTVAVAGGEASRLDLSVTGAGAIALTGADAEQLNATVVGTGVVTLAGRAGRARLLVNGPGKVDAGKLETGELVANLDGPGEIAARARYTAAVTNAGLGRVTVTGNAKCKVRGPGAASVACGILR